MWGERERERMEMVVDIVISEVRGKMGRFKEMRILEVLDIKGNGVWGFGV